MDKGRLFDYSYVTCPFASVPVMRALIPPVVRIPSASVNGGADSFATEASLAIDEPTSTRVVASMVALLPLPSVVVA